MRRVRLYAAAVADIAAAHHWYESQREGLGAEFERELNVLLERIGRTPDSFPLEHEVYRRAKLRIFPYLVFFRHDDEAVYVAMVLHISRSPEVRRRRLRSA
jgi:plasmid stabilization system protein ParE